MAWFYSLSLWRTRFVLKNEKLSKLVKKYTFVFEILPRSYIIHSSDPRWISCNGIILDARPDGLKNNRKFWEISELFLRSTISNWMRSINLLLNLLDKSNSKNNQH